MGFIAMHNYTELQTNRKGEIAKVKADVPNKGQAVPVAHMRIRVTEGMENEYFTLDKWMKIVASKGNEYEVNGRYEFPEGSGNWTKPRSVKLSPNGSGDDLNVKKGDKEWTTYHLASGLAEAFALVAQQTLVANENFRNLKDKR